MRLAINRRCDMRAAPPCWRALAMLLATAFVLLGFFLDATNTSALAQQRINEPRRKSGDMIDLVGVPLGSIDAPRAERPLPPPEVPAAPAPRPAPRQVYPMQTPPPPREANAPMVTAPPKPVHIPLPPPRPQLRLAPAAAADFVAQIPVETPAPKAQPQPQLPPTVTPPVEAIQALPPLPARREAPPTFQPDAFTDEAEEEDERRFQPATGPRARIEEMVLPRAEPLRRAKVEIATDTADPMIVGAINREQVSVIVRALPLDVALRDIGKMAGYTMNVSAGVQGTVRDQRLEGSIDQILDRLAQDFRLFWFNDGFTIHVDPMEETKTRFVRVAGMTQRELDRRLADAGLSRFRARIQFSSRDKLVRVIGSEAFLRTVEATISVPTEEKTQIKVIRFGTAGR